MLVFFCMLNPLNFIKEASNGDNIHIRAAVYLAWVGMEMYQFVVQFYYFYLWAVCFMLYSE